MMLKKSSAVVLLSVPLIFLCLCGMRPEPENVVRNKLEIILRDDLKYMESEIPKTAVSDTANYKITEFVRFSEKKYSYNAVVEYYYFKNIQMKQIRKYKYHSYEKKWERYFKEYKNY